MGFFSRILGICSTKVPSVDSAWRYQNGRVEIDLNKAPELIPKGGAVRLEGKGLPERVLVVHGEDGAFHAFRNKCAHVGGRRLDPLPGRHSVQCCSVGKSEYDYEGKFLSGAAKKPVPVFRVESGEDTLHIFVR